MLSMQAQVARGRNSAARGSAVSRPAARQQPSPQPRRRKFSPALGRDPLARPCPSRLPKIKIQTRRLLSPSPFKDRSPPPPLPVQRRLSRFLTRRILLSFTTMADDAQVCASRLSPACALLPHLVNSRCQLRPGFTSAHAPLRPAQY